MRLFVGLLFVVVYLFDHAHCLINEFSVLVEANNRECFSQILARDLTMFFDYQVISGGDLDITFWLNTPSNRVIISELRRNVGQHQFKTDEAGEYRFCFDNSFSRFANKQVFFYMYSPDNYVDPEFPIMKDEQIAKLDQDQLGELESKIDTFKQTFTRVQDHLERVQRFQGVFRMYEAIDHVLMGSNYFQVNFWSIVNITLMITVAVIQVIMIRSLFEEKSKLGRALRQGKLK